ncbi:MAG: hypothetical protein HXY50_07225 [Ignavibacteriaceae bacterium]|nr:hypothetical protein [Ignavibacteriaceae bacterium]
MLSLNLNRENFSLRTYFNFETDLTKQLKTDPRLRVYNFFLEGRDVFNVLSFRLGRQPMINSVVGGLFDGVNAKVEKGDFKLTAYYGGNVPAYQKFEFTDDWENDFILGGILSTTILNNFRISFGYVNKNFKAQEYNAIRLDEDLNPITVLIRNKSNQYQFASAEVSYEMKNYFTLDTRFDYDLNYEKTSKIELYGNYEQIKNLRLNIYYNYREPRVRYNSIFSVFDYGNTQEIEAGGDYTLSKNITISGKYGYVKYKDENSQRATVGLNTSFGTLSYRKGMGYAGELDAVSAYTAHTFFNGLLTPSVGLSFTSYKLSKDSEKNNLMTVLAGVNLRPLRTLSFDLQGQFMNNKIYKNDYRFLFKLNYWFNTNL